MKEIHYTIPISEEYQLPVFITNKCPYNKTLFFDIETTGFSAKNTTLYLIGVLYYQDRNIEILQWFNEDGTDEGNLIQAFLQFSKAFTHLIHFNGNGFDLPYLSQKAETLQIPFDVKERLTQIDIFKAIKPYKNCLGLSNMKQISIEKFLQIERTDTYSGGELIPIYQRYVAKPTSEYEQLLLLHNKDDLLGMPQISQILNYVSFFQELTIRKLYFEVDHNTQKLNISFEFPDILQLPKRILYQYQDFYLNAYQNHGVLSIPICQDTLFYFISDYKNYYYLPQEDMAIHKSVAGYVEPCNRIKATKNNCYIKKEDCFIPYFTDDTTTKAFRKTATDKTSFQTLDSFLNNTEDNQKNYLLNVLHTLK